MKTTATAFAIASAFAAVSAQGDLVIQSPSSLVQCLPALLRFSGGSAPYYISVLPGGQASATPLEQFPTQDGNSYTWTVDLAAGQDVTFSIRDSTGAINYSSQVPIQAGSDSSCLNGGGAAAGSSSSAPSSSASRGASSSASSPASSSAGSSSRTPLSITSLGATTASTATDGRNANAAQTSSPAPTGAASGNYAASMVAVAGVAGLVALFA